MSPRPPIVTILGHVDHGKTSLLDYIRKSRLADKEHGGITQRIGAYEIDLPLKGYQTTKITFIDTPGHEAFAQLRARGATVADIAILIIDAKDSLMPQTIESIAHIKNANIPFIVALNKTDLPDAKPEKVKNDLLKYDVQTEDKGGKVPTVEISAKTGKGIDVLLETILLIASDMNLTYDVAKPPQGFIIETKKDKRGVVASVVLKEGKIKVGDTVFADQQEAKVRAMTNDLGVPVTEVEPSLPFELLGFSELPSVGSFVTGSIAALQEAEAKPLSVIAPGTTTRSQEIEAFFGTPKEEKRLSLIIKAESQGAHEAIVNMLSKNLNTRIILSAVGDINRSDIFLAKTSKAIVIGFSVNIPNEVKELAKQEKVIIKTYNIIYELIEELNEVSDLMKEKELQEKSMKGEAKVLAQFQIEGERIWGVKVTKGKVNLSDTAELYRGDNLVAKSKLVSLKIRAKMVNEVKRDQEAGMVFSPPLDMKVGDVVKFIS